MSFLDNIFIPDGGDWGGVPWRVLHLVGYTTASDLQNLAKRLKTLAKLGVNKIILGIDYEFAYQSHPEMARGDGYIGADDAKSLIEQAGKYQIEIIPQFHCVSHQSWKEETFPLLREHPNLDVTPGLYAGNQGIESREWDPTNPKLYPIIFDLFDELIEAFDARAFHVGMDEIFLVGSRNATFFMDMDVDDAFANGINRIHQHLVDKKGVEMLMWGDRLVNGREHPLGISFSSRDGMHNALTKIPKDIIICDWQMERRKDFETMADFVEEGFRVLPVSWKDTGAIEDSLRYGALLGSSNVIGRIFTTWREEEGNPGHYQPFIDGVKLIKMQSDDKPAPGSGK